MKKIFISMLIFSFSLFFLTNNVSALTTTSGEFPEVPKGDNFVIIKRSDGTNRIFCWSSSTSIYVFHHNNYLYFSTKNIPATPNYNLNTTAVSYYNLSGSSWVYKNTTRETSFTFSSIIATNVDIIYTDTVNSYVEYESGYGLEISPNYEFKKDFYIENFDKYTLQFNVDKLLIEEQKEFNFRLEALKVNQQIPDTPILKLYKKVNNELILVEDDNITYDWREYEDSDYYYIDGYISFSEEVSYLYDYVLKIELLNVPNTIVKVYDDSSICSWNGSYNFLKNYTKYTYRGNSSGYAISYNSDYSGRIYIESEYLNSPYNFGAGYYEYTTKTKSEELIFYNYLNSSFSYVDFTIEYFNNNKDDNHIVILFKNIENSEDFVFYVPNELTVSEITASNFNDDGTVDFEFIMNTPKGEMIYNDGINYNFGDDEFIDTFTGAINFFITPIKEIFKLITIFYNNLTIPLKMFFVSLFGLVISVFIVRFLL